MDNNQITDRLTKHENTNDREIAFRVREAKTILGELISVRHLLESCCIERDEADRRAGAAERLLEQEKASFRKSLDDHRAVGKTVWATHEKQFTEITKDRDQWKERFEALDRATEQRIGELCEQLNNAINSNPTLKKILDSIEEVLPELRKIPDLIDDEIETLEDAQRLVKS